MSEWVCGQSPSHGVTSVGCGFKYERPPRRKWRRGQRINECRTIKCPECEHVDALYNRKK